jgi:CubicO group peptidase (beta-lactamase class C family)
MIFNEKFDATILQALDGYEVPGLAVSVVKDDRVIFSRGYGVKTLGGSDPVDEGTLFAIASISKSTTATCLAILVGEGRLRWEDRVLDYLPDFQLMDAYATREMRVRDLLIHVSGLDEVSGGTIWYGSDFSREEVVRRLRYIHPVVSFRGAYAYQNVMYLMAGQVIKAITGQTWDEFLEERVFHPLGMSDTTSHMEVLATRSNVATPHARVQGAVRAIPYRNHDNVGPAASVNTSAWELAQYARLHLGNGAFGKQRIIAPQAAAELYHPQVVTTRSWPDWMAPVRPHVINYGLGWFLQEYCGRKVVYHSGGVDGMRSLLTLLPEENLGIVVLTNQEARLTYPVTYTIVDSYLGNPAVDYFSAGLQATQADRQAQAAARQQVLDSRVPGTHPALPLEQYAGRYTHPAVDDLPITLEDGRLVLRFSHNPAFVADLEHWHYDTFRLVWRDPYIPEGLLTFRLNSRGQVESFQFDQPNLLDVDFKELGSVKRAA